MVSHHAIPTKKADFITSLLVCLEMEAEEEQLLSEEEEGDSTGPLDDDGVVREGVTSGEVEVTTSDEVQSSATGPRLFEGVRREWGRLVSSCWALQRRNWILLEAILLLKLAFPMVSISVRPFDKLI